MELDRIDGQEQTHDMPTETRSDWPDDTAAQLAFVETLARAADRMREIVAAGQMTAELLDALGFKGSPGIHEPWLLHGSTMRQRDASSSTCRCDSASAALAAARTANQPFSFTVDRLDIEEDNLLRGTASEATFLRAISARGKAQLLGRIRIEDAHKVQSSR